MNLLFRSTSVTKSLTTFLFLLHFFYVSAQPQNSAAKGNISGKIIDSISGQAIEYATISLVTENDNKVVNGTTSDNNGVFQMTDIEFGSYKMQLYFIGYQIKTERSLIISKEKPDLQLGAIKLANTKTNLKEVTVTAEKNIIENKIDKLVYNVDKDVTSQGGVAADVLKKVPQVSVDVDGNVELQGSSSIRFLINGKPSIIFGNNIADVLQSIPANQIQSIEVITSPGAKYDASGTGGIINIILKKSTAEGYNGNISLSGGTRLENGSVNLNIHHGHFGANAFVSGNAQLPSTTLNNMQRTS
ncbi:MAG: carboxypeptidase regulatory-like domain-containing protein, partial [Bacteroidia bacterium]